MTKPLSHERLVPSCVVMIHVQATAALTRDVLFFVMDSFVAQTVKLDMSR